MPALFIKNAKIEWRVLEATASTITTACAGTVPVCTTEPTVGRTIFTGFGFVDGQGTVIDGETIEALDGFFGAFFGLHAHKAKSLGAACVTIHDKGDFSNFTGLCKQGANLLFSGVIRHVSDI